jgi:hypothetical protein
MTRFTPRAQEQLRNAIRRTQADRYGDPDGDPPHPRGDSGGSWYKLSEAIDSTTHIAKGRAQAWQSSAYTEIPGAQDVSVLDTLQIRSGLPSGTMVFCRALGIDTTHNRPQVEILVAIAVTYTRFILEANLTAGGSAVAHAQANSAFRKTLYDEVLDSGTQIPSGQTVWGFKDPLDSANAGDSAGLDKDGKWYATPLNCNQATSTGGS